MVRAVLGYSFMVKKFTFVIARTTFKFIFHGIGTVSYGTSWREGQLDCFSMVMTTLKGLSGQMKQGSRVISIDRY
jgi:hypothetical protein